MSPFLSSTMRRFSRSSSTRSTSNPTQSSSNTFAQVGPTGSSGLHSAKQPSNPASNSALSSPHSRSSFQGGAGVGSGEMGAPLLQNNPNDNRPISSATDQSFEYQSQLHSRPVTSHPTNSAIPMPLSPTYSNATATNSLMSGRGSVGNLSRTDQIVLRHFWDSKYLENSKRDLHYLKFPFFPQYPSHKDLLPYCEIYHLVKTSPGATIISLGSANGVYIGFELHTGSQLHIDMEDEWRNISHNRVHFKSYDSVVRDPASDSVFKTWPKPLTIEFLEEQYQKWCQDLMSICWEGKEIRELGGGNGNGNGGGPSTAANSSLPSGAGTTSATATGLNGNSTGSTGMGAEKRVY